MRENKILETHLLKMGLQLKREQTRGDSKDKLITELEDLVSQLTEEIEKDKAKQESPVKNRHNQIKMYPN